MERLVSKKLIVINNEPTPADDKADLVIRGDVEDVIKQLIEMEENDG